MRMYAIVEHAACKMRQAGSGAAGDRQLPLLDNHKVEERSVMQWHGRRQFCSICNRDCTASSRLAVPASGSLSIMLPSPATWLKLRERLLWNLTAACAPPSADVPAAVAAALPAPPLNASPDASTSASGAPANTSKVVASRNDGLKAVPFESKTALHLRASR